MVLPYSAVLVLRAAAPARAVAHNPYSCLSEYGSTVLLSSLWRAALALEFTSLVHISLLALVPNFFYNMCTYIYADWTSLQPPLSWACLHGAQVSAQLSHNLLHILYN
jgi:hypothetical protein